MFLTDPSDLPHGSSAVCSCLACRACSYKTRLDHPRAGAAAASGLRVVLENSCAPRPPGGDLTCEGPPSPVTACGNRDMATPAEEPLRHIRRAGGPARRHGPGQLPPRAGRLSTHGGAAPGPEMPSSAAGGPVCRGKLGPSATPAAGRADHPRAAPDPRCGVAGAACGEAAAGAGDSVKAAALAVGVATAGAGAVAHPVLGRRSRERCACGTPAG
jgi:hypothetical protein